VREKKARLPADVVPCCGFQLVTDINQRGDLTVLRGTRIRPDKGVGITNWPQQQLENGIAKNNSTNYRYKYVVGADVDMGVRLTCPMAQGRDERFVNDVNQGFVFVSRLATSRFTKFALTTSTGCISA
jgi:hypothetical protein